MPIQRITSGILANGAIVAADIADGSVTTAKLADANVTTSKLASTLSISGNFLANNVTANTNLIVPAGSAGAPSIFPSGDTNTGIFFPAADTIAFAEGGAEAMRINSSGQVGIGTTSPAAPLQLATAGYFRLGDGTYYHTIRSGTGNESLDITANAGAADAVSVSAMRFLTSAGTAGVTEKARITGAGDLLVGLSTPNGTGKVIIQQNGNSNDNSYAGLDIYKGSSTTTTAQVFQRFFTSNGAGGSGSITANGPSGATFTAYSDRRLKENIQDLPEQLDNICRLKPSEFDYIGYPEGQGHQIGFIAQDMQEVYPDVVAADGEGMLQIAGWSKTEARLVKAIQELKAINDAQASRIETLEAKVSALESQ